MNLIVCGDALWISCGTWIAIWNGAFGAFIAALLGGLVALGVVRLTTADQRKQASEGRAIAAIADFVADAHAMRSIYNAGDGWAIEERYLRMKAALVRLRMASARTAGLSTLLEDWTYQLRKATLLYDRADTYSAPSVKRVAQLIEKVSMDVPAALPEWAFEIALRRNRQFPVLEDKVVAFTASLDSLDSEVEEEITSHPGRLVGEKYYPS
jgi:hypothetical protein